MSRPWPLPSTRIVKAARLAAPIFGANDWRWGDSRDSASYVVPSFDRIAITIRRLYESALENRTGCASSGRLDVVVDPDDGEVSVYVQLGVLRDPVLNWEPVEQLEDDGPEIASAA